MTDAELIAQLRMMPTYSGDPKGPHWLPNKAAARIEALIAERDAAERREMLAEDKAVEYLDRAEAAEAKLAKAVEALTNIDALDPENLVGGCSRDALSGLVNRMGDTARAALAEIEKPVAEWPEETGNIMVGKLKGEGQ